MDVQQTNDLITIKSHRGVRFTNLVSYFLRYGQVWFDASRIVNIFALKNMEICHQVTCDSTVQGGGCFIVHTSGVTWNLFRVKYRRYYFDLRGAKSIAFFWRSIFPVWMNHQRFRAIVKAWVHAFHTWNCKLYRTWLLDGFSNLLCWVKESCWVARQPDQRCWGVGVATTPISLTALTTSITPSWRLCDHIYADVVTAAAWVSYSNWSMVCRGAFTIEVV